MSKVKLKLDGALGMFQRNTLIDHSTQKLLGNTVINSMKNLMRSGISPVRGFGRYEAYSAQRNPKTNKDGSRSKSRYPTSVQDKYPDKKLRPVNLNLTGDLYAAITAKEIKNGVSIGHHNPTVDIQKKFQTHNVGVDPLVPQRKYLPDEGEGFVQSIMRDIKEIYLQRIKSVIRSK